MLNHSLQYFKKNNSFVFEILQALQHISDLEIFHKVFFQSTSFKNSVDFIGWYLSKARSSGIQNYEVEKLYLAYHEGYGGYKRGTFKEKDWLLSVAKKVKLNAATLFGLNGNRADAALRGSCMCMTT